MFNRRSKLGSTEESSTNDKKNIVEETKNINSEVSKVKDTCTDNEDTNEFDSPSDNKVLKILGIISGVLLGGLFAIVGLGLIAGLLFLVFMFIMMNMPNGKGIVLFGIILTITIYLLVKIIIRIVKY